MCRVLRPCLPTFPRETTVCSTPLRYSPPLRIRRSGPGTNELFNSVRPKIGPGRYRPKYIGQNVGRKCIGRFFLFRSFGQNSSFGRKNLFSAKIDLFRPKYPQFLGALLQFLFVVSVLSEDIAKKFTFGHTLVSALSFRSISLSADWGKIMFRSNTTFQIQSSTATPCCD